MECLFYFILFYYYFFFMETRNHLYRWSLVSEEEEEALPRIEPSKSYFWHYSTRRCNNMLIMLNQVNKYKNTLKTEIKPIFRENTNFEKHGCQTLGSHDNVNFEVHVTIAKAFSAAWIFNLFTDPLFSLQNSSSAGDKI